MSHVRGEVVVQRGLMHHGYWSHRDPFPREQTDGCENITAGNAFIAAGKFFPFFEILN